MLSFAQQNLKYPLQTREKLDFSLICRVVGTPLTIPQVDLCPTLASHGLKEEHVGQEPGPDHHGEAFSWPFCPTYQFQVFSTPPWPSRGTCGPTT